MKHYTEREIRALLTEDLLTEDLLTEGETPRPPAGLAERIKNEIPDHFDISRPQAVKRARVVPFHRRMRTYLMAASLLVTTGGAFLAYRFHQQVLPQASLDAEVMPAEVLPAEVLLAEVPPAEVMSGPTSAALVPLTSVPVASKPAPLPSIPVPAPASTPEPEVFEHQQDQVSRSKAVSETSISTEGVEERGVRPEPESEMARADTIASARMRTKAVQPPPKRAVRLSRGLAPRQLSMEAQDFSRPDKDTSPFINTDDDAYSTFVLNIETSPHKGDLPPVQDDFVIHVGGGPSSFDRGEDYHLLLFHVWGGKALQNPAVEVRAQVEFNPMVVSRHRLVDDEERNIAEGRNMTALYEIQTHGPLQEDMKIATIRLRYASLVSGKAEEITQTVTGKDVTGKR